MLYLFFLLNDAITTAQNTANAAMPKFRGNNPITSVADDTTSNWGALGTGLWYFVGSSYLIDQPSPYGFLMNFCNGVDEMHQIWFTQPSGSLYQRGGNYSGWDGTWRKMIDQTGGTFTGNVNVNSSPASNWSLKNISVHTSAWGNINDKNVYRIIMIRK